MKYVVMVGDGMADEWQDGSDEKTPLMAARTPVLDFLAERSELGLARTVPAGSRLFFTGDGRLLRLFLPGFPSGKEMRRCGAIW